MPGCTVKLFYGSYENIKITTPEDDDFVADDHAELYYVSIDTAGEIGWDSGAFNIRGRDSHVIELLTEATPDEYKAYLREKGVSYVIAGSKELDCRIAMEKLYSLFHIKK